MEFFYFATTLLEITLEMSLATGRHEMPAVSVTLVGLRLSPPKSVYLSICATLGSHCSEFCPVALKKIKSIFFYLFHKSRPDLKRQSRPGESFRGLKPRKIIIETNPCDDHEPRRKADEP